MVGFRRVGFGGGGGSTTTGPADHKVAASAADGTPDYLRPKLAAGAGVSLALLNGGADEQVQITAGDYPVVQISGSHTMAAGEYVIEYTGTGGHTLTLASAASGGAGVARPRYIINNGTGYLTIAAPSGQTIDTVGVSFSLTETLPPTAVGVFVPNGATKWQAHGPGAVLGSVCIDAPDPGVTTVFPFLVRIGGVDWLTCRAGTSSNQYIQAYKVLALSAGAVVNDGESITFGNVSSPTTLKSNVGGGLNIGTDAAQLIAFFNGTRRTQYPATSLLAHLDGASTVDAVARAQLDLIVDTVNHLIACLSLEAGFGLMDGPALP